MSVAPASLKRVLSRRDLILYGLVILTPTAPYPVYGIVQQTSHGYAALSYLVAMVAMLFTAASYGKMSGVFPSAGSTYTYAQNALNAHVGFLAGWAMILDYFLIPLLSVIYSALTANRLVPQVPYWIWAAAFTVAITLINVRGIRVTARAGNVMMALMTVCAVLFVVLAARYVAAQHGLAGLIAPKVFYDPATFSLRPLMLGAAIASLSYIGFDAISTLAEDTINPEQDISVATVLVCLIQTVFCVGTVYLAALVWPDFKTYPESETVILDIGRRAGGPAMMGFLTFILLVAGLASALTGQAGASRLLLGMGRDGVISRRIFRARRSPLCHAVAQRLSDGRGFACRIVAHPLSARGRAVEFRRLRRIYPGELERDPPFLYSTAASRRRVAVYQSALSAGRSRCVFLRLVEFELEGAGGGIRMAGHRRSLPGDSHARLSDSSARFVWSEGGQLNGELD